MIPTNSNNFSPHFLIFFEMYLRPAGGYAFLFPVQGSFRGPVRCIIIPLALPRSVLGFRPNREEEPISVSGLLVLGLVSFFASAFSAFALQFRQILRIVFRIGFVRLDQIEQHVGQLALFFAQLRVSPLLFGG